MINKKETFYSYEELTGRGSLDNRVYSESEVEVIGSLFEEFVDLYGDEFETRTDAYLDFMDAYDAVPVIKDIEYKKAEKVEKGNPKLARTLVTVAGGAVGLGSAKLMNRKDNILKKNLTDKVNSGLANKQDIALLDKVNKRMRLRSVVGTGLGAGLAYGGTALTSKYKTKKAKSDKLKSKEGLYSGKSFLTKSKKAANSYIGRTAIGAVSGHLIGQGATSFGEDAKRRRFLKAKKVDGTLTRPELEELISLQNKRTGVKNNLAKVGAVGGAVSKVIDNRYSDDQEFNEYYEDTYHLYEGDVDSAYSEFMEMRDSEFNFFSKVASGVTKVASAGANTVKSGITSGANMASNAIKTGAQKTGTALNSGLQSAKTGLTKVANTAKTGLQSANTGLQKTFGVDEVSKKAKNISKLASDRATGLKLQAVDAANAAKKAAKVAAKTAVTDKIASNSKTFGGRITNQLNRTANSAVKGAVVGAGVNAVRGKSIAGGAVGGAAIGAGGAKIYQSLNGE